MNREPGPLQSVPSSSGGPGSPLGVGGGVRDDKPGVARLRAGANRPPVVGNPKGRIPSAAAHFSHTALLNRLRAEIKAPLTLRRVRPQTLRRSFWNDRAWIPAKLILLAALFLMASLL